MLIIHDCEQNTSEWDALRAGRPTASAFSRIVTGSGKPSDQLSGYAAELAAELYAGKPLESWGGNRATERGHEVEPLARANYEFMNDVVVKRIGFATNHDAGCSPDGLVGDDGLHEVKCQLPKGHVETLAYYHRNKKCPAGYIPQVQGQLLILEREWVDLNFYHPDLRSLVIRIYRDEAFIRALLRQIKAVNEKRDAYVEILKAA